ncbi:MAG: DUF1553 domain-containing protein, partial [Planctomycetaceae bacterium]|nr:DUF1553 domain-containing protein [Planctomycetaceae bacterium]
GEFGKLGSLPSHPELLDWLASEFRESGWSLKSLHYLILTSTAWRQSSFRDPARDAIDPENRFYWRKSLQRLDAEVLRDRMLVASDTLNRELFGPPVAIKEDDTGQVIVDGNQTRRSLYIRVRRTQPVAMLQSFGAPVMKINCELRPVSTVATQSLIMLNGEYTIEQAGRVADRVLRETPLLNEAELSRLPSFPQVPQPVWSYGSGRIDEAQGRVIEFVSLPHWTGGQWQGGENLPDSRIGWVLLNAQGGHPGNPRFAAVRRWIAPAKGLLSISGALHHPVENGDGVRGRIVSASRGVIGEWNVHHGTIDTMQSEFAVESGETIDFVTDCREHENSDSFQWTVHLTLKTEDGTVEEFDSSGQFHGPMPDPRQLPSQIDSAWQFILLRHPSPEELNSALRFAERQLSTLNEHNANVPAGSSATRQVLVNLCQMLLNSNEFLYID